MSPKARKNFESIFSKKKIFPSRKIIFQNLGELDNPESLFYDLECNDFLKIHENYYPELIKFFYTNLTVKDDVLFNRVNGIDIKISFGACQLP